MKLKKIWEKVRIEIKVPLILAVFLISTQFLHIVEKDVFYLILFYFPIMGGLIGLIIVIMAKIKIKTTSMALNFFIENIIIFSLLIFLEKVNLYNVDGILSAYIMGYLAITQIFILVFSAALNYQKGYINQKTK